MSEFFQLKTNWFRSNSEKDGNWYRFSIRKTLCPMKVLWTQKKQFWQSCRKMFGETPNTLLKVRKKRNRNTFGKILRKFPVDTMNKVSTTMVTFFAQKRRALKTITFSHKINHPLKWSPGHVKLSFDNPAERILSDSQLKFKQSHKMIEKKARLIKLFRRTFFLDTWNAVLTTRWESESL